MNGRGEFADAAAGSGGSMATLAQLLVDEHPLMVVGTCPLGQVAGELVRTGARYAVVVGRGDGIPMGFLTRTAVARAGRGAIAAEAMTPLVVYVPVDHLSHALALMQTEGVQELAVLGPDGRLVGVLSGAIH
jgi:CBS domain-containing protein